MDQLLTLTIIFITLFLAQTAIYSILLLRLKRKYEKTSKQIELQPLNHDINRDITKLTETELKIMREIAERKLIGARDLSLKLGLSREHVARTLKKLVDEGLLIREGKPYKYRLSDLGEKALRSHDITGGENY
ncbi:MAG: MarR family transcriptional regulator [Thaumarchaeota archaeon]|nr:MarR family transcriptional regulator [Nitrososphaerota archaeon]